MPQEKVPCHYCQRLLRPEEVTKDHVVPRARGGVDIRWNIVPACGKCNRRKGDSWPNCYCNFCRRTRRRHWQLYGIHEHNYKPRG